MLGIGDLSSCYSEGRGKEKEAIGRLKEGKGMVKEGKGRQRNAKGIKQRNQKCLGYRWVVSVGVSMGVGIGGFGTEGIGSPRPIPMETMICKLVQKRVGRSSI